MAQPGVRYSFEGHVLDPYRRTLTRDGVEISLGERSFSVLLLLVENAGELVPKHELMDRVWGDVVVVEDNLVKAIAEVRHALGDKPAEGHFIRTVYRRGYRFVAPVQPVDHEVNSGGEHVPVKAPEQMRPAVLWGVAAIAIIVLVVAVGFVMLRDSGSMGGESRSETVARELSNWKIRPVEGVPSGLIKPAFSPVSQLLVAVTTDRETGIHSLFLVARGATEPVQLTRGIEVRGPDPTFSSDGRNVWFTTYRFDSEEGLVPAVMTIPTVGGEPRMLIPRATAASPRPGGAGYVAAIVEPDGTVIEVIDQDRRVRIAESGYWPRWSPDGSWIAYTTSNPEGGDGDVWIARPDGADPRRLTSAPSQMYGLCWSPDSAYVVFSSDLNGTMDLWVAGVDGQEPQPLTRGPGSFSSPSFSHDHEALVFTHSPVNDSILIAASPEAPSTVVVDRSNFFSSSLSPDGRAVAVAAESPSRAPTLSVIEIESGRRREFSDLSYGSVSWTPDGESLLVTASSPDEQARWIWLVPLDGDPPKPLTLGADNWDWPVMSPDGSEVAASREKPGGRELVILNLRTGTETSLGLYPVIEGVRWSPDGRLVAWSGDPRPADAASNGIWVVPRSGGSARRLSLDGTWPVWDPSGKALIFARFLDHDGLWRVPVVGGLPERIRGPFEPEGYFLEGLDSAARGSKLLFHTMTDESGLYVLEKP